MQLESVYRSAKIVANICVYAATDKNKPIAIIVPVESALKALAEQNGIPGNSLEELVHNEKLNRIVLKELQDAGRQGKLSGVEIIDGVVMADEEWTTANVGLLLPNNPLLPLLTRFFVGYGHGGAEDPKESDLEQV